MVIRTEKLTNYTKIDNNYLEDKNISLKALAFPSSKLSSWLSVIFKSLSASSLDSSILSLASLKHCPISFTLISYKIKKYNF